MSRLHPERFLVLVCAIAAFAIAGCNATSTRTSSAPPKQPTKAVMDNAPNTGEGSSESASRSGDAETLALAFADEAGVHLYEPASGTITTRCHGPAGQPWYVTPDRVAFLDAAEMSVAICDLDTGTRRTVAAVRLGEQGARPDKVSLWLTEDGQRACVFEASTAMSGWQVIEMPGGASEYRLRSAGQQAIRVPSACDRPARAPAGGGPQVTLSSDGAFMFPVFVTKDGHWAVGAASPDATHESVADAFSNGKQPLVFVADLSSGAVFPLKEGSWPAPVDTTKPFSAVASSVAIGVNFDDTVSDQPCAGCIGVGPYLVELGASVRPLNGKPAVSAATGEVKF